MKLVYLILLSYMLFVQNIVVAATPMGGGIYSSMNKNGKTLTREVVIISGKQPFVSEYYLQNNLKTANLKYAKLITNLDKYQGNLLTVVSNNKNILKINVDSDQHSNKLFSEIISYNLVNDCTLVEELNNNTYKLPSFTSQHIMTNDKNIQLNLSCGKLHKKINFSMQKNQKKDIFIFKNKNILSVIMK